MSWSAQFSSVRPLWECVNIVRAVTNGKKSGTVQFTADATQLILSAEHGAKVMHAAARIGVREAQQQQQQHEGAQVA